jgi:EpsD family peptidyl-prolyl cis-trans isomerase
MERPRIALDQLYCLLERPEVFRVDSMPDCTINALGEGGCMTGHGKSSLILATLVLLAACGDKTATAPTAMKVNGKAISVAEVESQLLQYQSLPDERKQAVTKNLLASLADSEMLHQAALKEKLDLEQAMQIRLNATRRLILANAYIESTMAAVPKPSDADVQAYFEANPARYAERKMYDLQEISIQAAPQQVAAIDALLAGPLQLDALMDHLRDRKIQHVDQHLVVSAEKVLEPILQKLGNARQGEFIRLADQGKLTLLFVNAIQAQPLSLDQATPLIQAHLYEARKAESMEAMLKQLRDQTRIEYFPPYSAAPKS